MLNFAYFSPLVGIALYYPWVLRAFVPRGSYKAMAIEIKTAILRYFYNSHHGRNGSTICWGLE